jgi:hypothetical protein
VPTAPGSPFDELLRPLYEAHAAALPAGATWFDAHTHIGHDDPDGFEADPEDLIAGLDGAGQHRALVFPSQEPAGYPPANDRVLAACADSGGRLDALARVDPNAPDALEEARRCLEAGARGFKLHPRSDGFALPHPVVEEVVALAGDARVAVLFHAGRGIPHLGESVVHMAREHRGARLILAHAGISDTGWIAPYAAELPNLFFDTSWWQVADLLALFTTVPPGHILYASDMPYGSPLFQGLAFLRCALLVGLEGDALRAMAGASLERVLAGEEPLDLGPRREQAGSGRATSRSSVSSPTSGSRRTSRSARCRSTSRSGWRRSPAAVPTPTRWPRRSSGCSTPGARRSPAAAASGTRRCTPRWAASSWLARSRSTCCEPTHSDPVDRSYRTNGCSIAEPAKPCARPGGGRRSTP